MTTTAAADTGASVDRSASFSSRFVTTLVPLYFLTGIAVTILAWSASQGRAPIELLLKALSVNYFLSVGLLAFHKRAGSFGAALLCVLALLIGISVVGQYWFLLLVAAGLSCWLYLDREFIFVEPMSLSSTGGMVLGAAVFGLVVLAGRSWGNIVGPGIDFNILAGNVHLDSLYHTSLASMIRGQGVVSTGLHGTPRVVYHVFSHFLLSRISATTGLSVLETYGMAQCIALAPLLFLSALSCAEELAPSLTDRQFWIRVALVAVSFMAPLGVKPGTFGAGFSLDDSCFFSESYCLSLTLLMAMIGALVGTSTKWRWPTVLMLVGVAAAAKVSVGAIAISLLAVHLVLFERKGRLLAWAGIAAVVFGALFIIPVIRRMHSNYGFHLSFEEPFQFAKYYGPVPVKSSPRNPEFWLPFAAFTLLHFLNTWLFLSVAYVNGWWRRDRTAGQMEALALNLTALAIGLTAIAILPCRTEGGIGGDVSYFSNVAMFVALPWLLIVLSKVLAQPVMARHAAGWWVSAGVVAAGIVGVSIHAPPYLSFGLQRLSEKNPETSENFPSYIRHLLEVRDDESTRGFLVYIPKEEHGFWEGGPPMLFGELSLLVPAISERPALFGLPIPNLKRERQTTAMRKHLTLGASGFSPRGYGYDSYTREAFITGAEPRVPDEVLAAETRRLGFKGYIDLTANGWTKHSLATQ